MNLEVGNVVRVKSIRGPYMMVSELQENGESGAIICKWFAEREETFKEEKFYPGMLEKVR